MLFDASKIQFRNAVRRFSFSASAHGCTRRRKYHTTQLNSTHRAAQLACRVCYHGASPNLPPLSLLIGFGGRQNPSAMCVLLLRRGTRRRLSDRHAVRLG